MVLIFGKINCVLWISEYVLLFHILMIVITWIWYLYESKSVMSLVDSFLWESELREPDSERRMNYSESLKIPLIILEKKNFKRVLEKKKSGIRIWLQSLKHKRCQNFQQLAPQEKKMDKQNHIKPNLWFHDFLHKFFY